MGFRRATVQDIPILVDMYFNMYKESSPYKPSSDMDNYYNAVIDDLNDKAVYLYEDKVMFVTSVVSDDCLAEPNSAVIDRIYATKDSRCKLKIQKEIMGMINKSEMRVIGDTWVSSENDSVLGKRFSTVSVTRLIKD